MEINKDTIIELPDGSDPVAFHEQHVPVFGDYIPRETLQMWVNLDPSLPRNKTRTFRVVGTGCEFPDNYKFIGTVIRKSDNLVWHLHENVEE